MTTTNANLLPQLAKVLAAKAKTEYLVRLELTYDGVERLAGLIGEGAPEYSPEADVATQAARFKIQEAIALLQAAGFQWIKPAN